MVFAFKTAWYISLVYHVNSLITINSNYTSLQVHFPATLLTILADEQKSLTMDFVLSNVLHAMQ